ncbi:hypothetical protein Hanom_Chr14g01320261 [Helianthus anomalus]
MDVVSIENVPGKDMGEGVANVEVEAEILEDYVGPVNGHLVEEVGIELNGTRIRIEGDLGTVDGLSFDMPVGNDVNGGKKKKRRSFFRKKSKFDKSPSPSGLERTKKQARDGDDPYDIDRFIFSVQQGPNELVESEVMQEEYVTPDLNAACHNKEEEANVDGHVAVLEI